MTTLPLPHFGDALHLARDEALHILRLVMRTTTADDPESAPAPTREARLAACAVLRLPIPDDEEADLPSDHPTPPPHSPPPSRSFHTSAPRSPAPAPASSPPTDAADPIYPVPPPDERLPSAISAAHTPEFIAPEDPLITSASPLPSHHKRKLNTDGPSPHSLLARAGAGPPSPHHR